jgi:hypothetical protein
LSKPRREKDLCRLEVWVNTPPANGESGSGTAGRQSGEGALHALPAATAACPRGGGRRGGGGILVGPGAQTTRSRRTNPAVVTERRGVPPARLPAGTGLEALPPWRRRRGLPALGGRQGSPSRPQARHGARGGPGGQSRRQGPRAPGPQTHRHTPCPPRFWQYGIDPGAKSRSRPEPAVTPPPRRAGRRFPTPTGAPPRG